jgi:hypothetical protein
MIDAACSDRLTVAPTGRTCDTALGAADRHRGQYRIGADGSYRFAGN